MQHIVMILPIFLILTVPCAAFPEIGDEFRATIESVQIRDKSGSVIGSGDVGETILIQSPITINKLDGYDDTMQEYTYYAQIKVAEKDPHVQYVGVYEGVLDTDGTVTAWIMWTPEQAGLYYVETYVWNGMEALTNPGPVLLVLIN